MSNFIISILMTVFIPRYYRYDLVDLTRQALAKYANQVFLKIIEGYQVSRLKQVMTCSKHFLDLVTDMDVLLSSHDGFLLGPWLESAKQLARDSEQEKQVMDYSSVVLQLKSLPMTIY